MIQPPKVELIPLSIAANILKLTDRRVRMLCQEGKIKSAVRPSGEGGTWLVDKAEIQRRMVPRDG